MKQFLKKRWVVPVATIILTLSIGTAAFAATASSSTATSASGSATAVTAATGTAATPAAGAQAPAGATASNPWGNQRSDETLLTGTTAAQVKAVAVAKIGTDATVVRVETDSDASQTGHAAYEVHMVKADGTAVTVYVDKSFNYVSTETQPTGGHAGAPAGGQAGAPGGQPTTAPGSASSTSSTDSAATSSN